MSLLIKVNSSWQFEINLAVNSRLCGIISKHRVSINSISSLCCSQCNNLPFALYYFVRENILFRCSVALITTDDCDDLILISSRIFFEKLNIEIDLPTEKVCRWNYWDRDKQIIRRNGKKRRKSNCWLIKK